MSLPKKTDLTHCCFPNLFTLSLRFLRQDVCYPLLKIKGISLKNVPNIPRKTGKNEFSTKKTRSVSIIDPSRTTKKNNKLKCTSEANKSFLLIKYFMAEISDFITVVIYHWKENSIIFFQSLVPWLIYLGWSNRGFKWE